MSTFVGIPQFSNPQWVAMETMLFHIAHINFFEDIFVSQSEGPNEQFGTPDKIVLGGVQGNLNWMPG